MDKETAYKRLKDRLMLHARGIVVPPRKWWIPIRDKQSFYGGAGPQGRVYYISYDAGEDSSSEMISLPMYPKGHYLAEYAISVKRDKKNIHNLILDNGIKLIGRVPTKAREMSFSDGKQISRSGLVNVHCYGTYSTSASWDCKHFDNKEQCKYCTINLTKKWLDNTTMSDEYIVEALKITVSKSKIRSVTITGGSSKSPEETVRNLISLVKRIRDEIDITLHVQFEPIDDFKLLNELSKYVDSVGIFIEIFDENIRKNVCPGKGKNQRNKYFDNWEKAVKVFGKGKVGTSCLLGFGENYNNILGDIERCIKLGVTIMPLLIRPGSKYLGERFIPSYVGKEEELLVFHIKLAELLVKNDLEPEVAKVSGCIGCMGCSAIMKACEYVKLTSNLK